MLCRVERHSLLGPLLGPLLCPLLVSVRVVVLLCVTNNTKHDQQKGYSIQFRVL